MKKVLFATTALVATAGIASAEVSLSGSAEMGIVGGDTINNTTGVVTNRETQFHTDIDVTFTMSGQTDNGLVFGATVDLDESVTPAAFATNTQGGETIFISGNFGTLTMGDTDGALDWAMAEVPVGAGSLDDASTVHAGFNGNGGLDGLHDGQILRYDHSIAGFGFAVSAEIDDTPGAAQLDPVIGIGVTYGFDFGAAPLNIGVGYQSGESAVNVDRETFGISLGTTVSGISLGLNYSEVDDDLWVQEQTHFGIGAAYTMDAITVGVNYGIYDDYRGVAGDEAEGYGLSAGYDLGGGASILLGYANSDITLAGVNTDADFWSLGVSMSF